MEPICTTYENGDYGYQVELGFIIKINDAISSDVLPYNIDKLTHWC